MTSAWIMGSNRGGETAISPSPTSDGGGSDADAGACCTRRCPENPIWAMGGGGPWAWLLGWGTMLVGSMKPVAVGLVDGTGLGRLRPRVD